MTTAPCLISPYVQAFFVEHLQQHKRLSPQTIASYRDTFRLLLNFMKQTRGIEPSALRLTDLDAPMILTFLTIWNSNAATGSVPATFASRRCGRSFDSWPCGRPTVWRSPPACWPSPASVRTKS